MTWVWLNIVLPRVFEIITYTLTLIYPYIPLRIILNSLSCFLVADFGTFHERGLIAKVNVLNNKMKRKMTTNGDLLVFLVFLLK